MVTITGATGNTGSKIATILLKNGEKVRAIGRSEERLKKLKDLGAEICIGDQNNENFLYEAFLGSDAVYLMIPPKYDTDDIRAYDEQLSTSSLHALTRASIKKLVFLSSLGAELESGTGPVLGLHDVELKLQSLRRVDIAILRAGYFMENTLWNIPLIKEQKINGGSVIPDIPVLMVATQDIAEKAAELLQNQEFYGLSIFELFGHRITFEKITRIISEKIGNPDLRYVQFSDEDAISGMVGSLSSQDVAESLLELAHAFNKGLIKTNQVDPYQPTTGTTYGEFVEKIFLPIFLRHS